MKFKVVLVPFPFDDFSASKLRPAVCLTNTISTYNHLVIAFISSQVNKADEKSDIRISRENSDFLKTGLKVDSAIRLHRLVTIPQNLILRELGMLPHSLQEVLKEKLRVLFDL